MDVARLRVRIKAKQTEVITKSNSERVVSEKLKLFETAD